MSVKCSVCYIFSVYRVCEKYCEEILIGKKKRWSRKKEINQPNCTALALFMHRYACN
jgi:hypothetical protein